MSTDHCINISQADHLDPAVVKAVTNNQSNAVAVVEAHLAVLGFERTQMVAEHTENKKEFRAKRISESNPAQYTNREKKDPLNELNDFETTGWAKLKKNLVQLLGSISNALGSDLFSANGIEAKERKVIEYFNSDFHRKMSGSIDRIYKQLDSPFRYRDMAQYLPKLKSGEGLDQATKGTIAATAFEWVHTNGRAALQQTNATMKALLGLDDKAPLPPNASEVLREVGFKSEALAKQLGAKIAKRLEIKATDEADSTAQARFELSLGFMAIAAMEDMKIFRRQEVYTGFESTDKNEFGIAALKKGLKLKRHEVYYEPSDEQRAKDTDPLDLENTGKKDKSTMEFVKIDNINMDGSRSWSDFIGPNDEQYPAIPDYLQKGTDLMKGASNAFDKLFNNAPDVRDFSFKKIKLNPFVGRDSEAAKQQIENLQKSIDVPYDKSEHTMGLFMKMSEKTMGKIAGMVDRTNKMNVRNDSIDGINDGIARDLQKLLDWHTLADEQPNSTFYINAQFMNQFRMNMTGDTNPQGSKLMRNLFSPTSWNTDFKTTPATKAGKNYKKTTGLERAFLEAIALSFGIDSGKVGGSENQINELAAKVNDPAIRAALGAIKHQQRTGELTSAMETEIAEGVAATGEKVHGFKGLVEYARYETHRANKSRNKGEFTSDMYNEIDGVSNGVIIGIIQLIPDSANKRAVLASLALGGMSIDPNANKIDPKTGEMVGNLDKLLAELNDAYKRMGQEWALEIDRLKEELSTSDDRFAPDNYDSLIALENILGKFTDKDGVLVDAIRKMAKPRTMQTQFGAGMAKQNEIFSSDDVISTTIYGGIEKIIERLNSPDIQGNTKDLIENDLRYLMKWSAVLATKEKARQKVMGIEVKDWNLSGFMTDGSLDVNKLKAFEFNYDQLKEIAKNTQFTYGKAMLTAVDTVYAPIIEARKPFIAIIQRATTTYNMILERKVTQAIEAGDADLDRKNDKGKFVVPRLEADQLRGRIAKVELDEIVDSISHLIPTIKTPMGGTMALAIVGPRKIKGLKQKDYNEAVTVTQQYTKDANGKGLSKNVGYVDSIPYLKDAGSSAMVRSIHMMDSMVANGVMGLSGVDILNAHDASIHSFRDNDAVRDNLNQTFFDTMNDYSLGDQIMNMHIKMREDLFEEMTSAGLKVGEIIEAFRVDRVIDANLIGLVTIERFPKETEAAHRERVYAFVEAAIDEMRETPKGKKNLDYITASEKWIDSRIPKTALDRKQLLAKIQAQISNDASAMTGQVVGNKDKVMGSVTHSGNYSHKGIGKEITPTEPKATIFDNDRGGPIPVNGVIVIDQELLKLQQNESASFWTEEEIYADEGLGSSTEGVSTKPEDYLDSRTINKKNVTEVLEGIVELDSHDPHASVPDSPEHIEYLKGLLNGLVSKVMTPVQMFMAQHKVNDETRGFYEVDEQTGNKIWIQRQQVSGNPTPGMLTQGIRMSAAEVYVHELVHHVTHVGLKLDRHLTDQVYDLYELVQAKFTAPTTEGGYGENAFRVFLPEGMDHNDPANAEEVTAAKARWKYIFEAQNKKDAGHKGLDEFVTIGLTNEHFKKQLSALVIPDSTIKARKALAGIWQSGDLQKTLINIFTRILDVIHQTFYRQRHSTTAGKELENLALALSQVEARSKTALFRSAYYLEAKATVLSTGIDKIVKRGARKVIGTTKLGAAINKIKDSNLHGDMSKDEMDGAIRRLKNDPQFKGVSTSRLREGITKLNKLPELDNILSHQMRLLMSWYEHSEQGLIASIVTEAKGTTKRLKPLHHLLTRRTMVLDAAKLEASGTMMKVANEYFKRELKPHEKTAITKILMKTDLSSLWDLSSAGAIKGFITNKVEREAQISRLVVELGQEIGVTFKGKHHTQVLKFFENAADDLGYYMVHSQSRPGSMPYYNAANIIKADKTRFLDALEGDAKDKAIALVDQLATVSAFRYTQRAHGQVMVDLMNEDIGSIESVVQHHNLLKDQALTELFNNSPHLIQKGYTKQILNARIQYEQGTLADKERYENAGWIMQETPIKRDPNDPIKTDIYMFKSTLGTVNDLQPGIMSVTQNSSKGKGAYDLVKQAGGVTGISAEAKRNNQYMLMKTRETVKAMSKQRSLSNYRAGSTNHMVPQFDANGKMTELRYVMSEFTKDNVLQQHSEFDAVLASMGSQIVDKKATPEINADLVNALLELYEHKEYGFKQMPEAFVEISPLSENKRYRDIYQLLPPKTQAHIESQWGSHKMMVPRDVVDLAFGQRKYSIVEMFGKTAEERNMFEATINEIVTFALGWHNPFKMNAADDTESKKRARVINRAKMVEDFMTQLTQLAKSNIVVRNLPVISGNSASNMMLLKSKGIPLDKIQRLSREAFASSMQYQKQNSELKNLQLTREIVKRKQSIAPALKKVNLENIDRKIKRLGHNLAKNPSTKMIAAGLMPSVVDDVDTADIQNPYKHGLDATIDVGLGKLPKIAEKAARTIFMTTDTEGYKIMNNAVRMTDYVGRYVLYSHLVENGMSEQDAISEVTDVFINFALPTHRMIEFANAIGVVWFSKYQIRVLKQIRNVLKDNPFTAVATFILGSYIGDNNIINSIPGITKDADQAISNAVAAAHGSVGDILLVDATRRAGSIAIP